VSGPDPGVYGWFRRIRGEVDRRPFPSPHDQHGTAALRLVIKMSATAPPDAENQRRL